MRILHTADWHIGFRSGDRMTSTGINQREADVATTFVRLIDRAIALEPDVIVAAGDLFDRPSPGNPATIHAYLQLQRLRKWLASTPVVLIAGNHDSTKIAGAGSLLPLYATIPDVHVVDRRIEHVRLGDVTVTCVPEAPGVRCGELTPDPSARYNLALIHGEVQGMPRKGGKPVDEISRDQIGDRWDYVALGHYHVAHEIAPRCWYSGSIDYTSTDIWGERRQEIEAGPAGKGFIVRDLSTGAHEFHPLPASRPVIDLDGIDARGMTPEAINVMIAENVNDAAIDGAIVRLKVVNAPQGFRKEVDHRAVKSWRKRALSFTLTIELEEVERPLSTTLHDSKITRESLSQLVNRKLGERDLPAGLPQAEFLALGAAYMEQAAAKLGEEIAHEPTSIAPADNPQRKAS